MVILQCLFYQNGSLNFYKMKEHIARLAIATTLGAGAWFAGNFDYVKKVPENAGPSASNSRTIPEKQGTESSSTLELRTPEIVAKINSAIATLEACSDQGPKEAAAKFIALNADAKIALAYRNEIGEDALGVMVVEGEKNNFVPQIGIAPQVLLDTRLSAQEVGVQMFKAIYVIEAIKNSPSKYNEDQDFRDLINNQAGQVARESFCAK
jgi:hypothetical protein